MSLQFYKVIHLIGLFATFGSLAAMALMRQTQTDVSAVKKHASIVHGVGLLLVLVGGFGAMARLGITGSWPGWIYVKIGLWLLAGGALVAFRKSPPLARFGWWALPLVGGFGAYLAVYKPF